MPIFVPWPRDVHRAVWDLANVSSAPVKQLIQDFVHGYPLRSRILESPNRPLGQPHFPSRHTARHPRLLTRHYRLLRRRSNPLTYRPRCLCCRCARRTAVALFSPTSLASSEIVEGAIYARSRNISRYFTVRAALVQYVNGSCAPAPYAAPHTPPLLLSFISLPIAADLLALAPQYGCASNRGPRGVRNTASLLLFSLYDHKIAFNSQPDIYCGIYCRSLIRMK